ncbi:MAG: glycosyltransferase [Chitinophagales bacterium]
MNAWQIIFWICVASMVHSYLLYPWLLKLVARGKEKKASLSTSNENVQSSLSVSVIMSVYNEERVIENKIRSVFKTKFPASKLEMVIGSDGSTDATDVIIEKLITEGYNIHFKKFGGRNGKSNIINALVPLAKGEIFMLTDANILFDEHTIPQLINHFNDEAIGLVGANIINTGLRKDGISFQEKTYIQRENMIKYREGILWGTMMGAFGACYAIRSTLFTTIPPTFLMEDFFITLNVLKSGKKAVADLQANAYEDVSNLVKEEFKRKVRISAGNFQNLGVFYPLLIRPFSGIGFSFLSHKVLRWLGPLFIIGAFVSSALLYDKNLFYRLLFFLQVAGFISPLIDNLMSRMNMHNFAIRLIAYFYMMNFALLLGLAKYIRGIRSNTWNPTQRNI